MKFLLATLLISLTSFSFGQDTTDVYVINSTNRLVSIDNSQYAFEFRDLRSLKEIHALHFKTSEDLVQFFDFCEEALEVNNVIETMDYTISRNKLSKNLIKVQDIDEGYVLLTYSTVERMRKAFEKDKAQTTE